MEIKRPILSQTFKFKDQHQRDDSSAFRCSPLLNEFLNLEWSRRTYPNPKNKNEELGFKSKQDFLNFCIRRCGEMEKLMWEFFAMGKLKFQRV